MSLWGPDNWHTSACRALGSAAAVAAVANPCSYARQTLTSFSVLPSLVNWAAKAQQLRQYAAVAGRAVGLRMLAFLALRVSSSVFFTLIFLFYLACCPAMIVSATLDLICEGLRPGQHMVGLLLSMSCCSDVAYVNAAELLCTGCRGTCHHPRG